MVWFSSLGYTIGNPRASCRDHSDARRPLSLSEPPGTAQERAWIEGIVAGDEAAFEAMFRCYNRELYRFAVRMTGSPDDAEEVVQAVFVAV